MVKAPALPSSIGAPAFAGLRRASTVCAGGGPGSAQTASFRLSWSAATDRGTASPRIVYEVFASHAPGGEDFSTPMWTTAPGATSFTTPALPVGSYYFVVRARDRAHHEDRNRVERKAAGGRAYRRSSERPFEVLEREQGPLAIERHPDRVEPDDRRRGAVQALTQPARGHPADLAPLAGVDRLERRSIRPVPFAT